MNTLLAYVVAFFTSPVPKTVLGLVLLDVGLAVILAIQLGVFDFSKLADFLRTKVVPAALGLLLSYVASKFIVVDQLGPYSNLAGTVIFDAIWSLFLITMVADIVDKLGTLGVPGLDRIANGLNMPKYRAFSAQIAYQRSPEYKKAAVMMKAAQTQVNQAAMNAVTAYIEEQAEQKDADAKLPF